MEVELLLIAIMTCPILRLSVFVAALNGAGVAVERMMIKKERRKVAVIQCPFLFVAFQG